MIRRVATIIENTVRIGFVFAKAIFKNKGKETPATIEDKETMRVLNRINKNTPKAQAQGSGRMQMTTPRIVATPFPPLNPAKTGKMWPIRAATPRPN